MSRDLPGGPVVKNPPWNADNMGLIPGPGNKISHAMDQLEPWLLLFSVLFNKLLAVRDYVLNFLVSLVVYHVVSDLL